MPLEALEMALWRRGRALEGLVHHSDRGSQYTSIRYTERLAEAGIAPSVGSAGEAYDNALAESTIGLYKTELIDRQRPWRTPERVEIATLEYIDWWNNRRLHSEIGDIPPAEKEALYHAAIEREEREFREQDRKLKPPTNPARFSLHVGMGGRFGSEWVAAFAWNGWPGWLGICRGSTTGKCNGLGNPNEHDGSPRKALCFSSRQRAKRRSCGSHTNGYDNISAARRAM